MPVTPGVVVVGDGRQKPGVPVEIYLSNGQEADMSTCSDGALSVSQMYLLYLQCLTHSSSSTNTVEE